MLRVRRAKRQDAVLLARAEAATARVLGLLVQRPGEIPTEAFAAKIDALKRRGRYVVAEENGKVAGHAFLEPMRLAANRHVFQLNIVVHPRFKGRGIGTALMIELISWAQARAQVGKIELLVRSTNTRALALYRRFGFAREGRLVGRIKRPDGKLVDDLVMAWFPKRRHAR